MEIYTCTLTCCYGGLVIKRPGSLSRKKTATRDLLAVVQSAGATALIDPPHISFHVYFLATGIVTSSDFHCVLGHIRVVRA